LALSGSEAARKLVHVGVGGFALALRVLTWPQAAACAVAAFFFNWQVLPRIGGRSMWRGTDRERGYPIGILIYPLAVLALILAFRESLDKVAVVWAILAVGDGMAAIVGQAVGGPRLPWNPGKGWAGLAAFVAFGTPAAMLFAAWTCRMPLSEADAWLWPVLPIVALCALVESLPTTLDDNLTVPLAGGLLVALFSGTRPEVLLGDPGLPTRLVEGLLANGLIAAAAYKARSIDVAGATSAVVIGTTITATLGWPGLAVMIAFFVVGSAVTKLGYRIKAARGIAQEKGGARGWRNAWANGGVPALLALLAGLHVADEPRLLLTVAYAAAVATAAADTCSSEVGKAYGRRTFLITSLRPVPPGTEGAVSLEGTLGGLLGGLIVAAVGAAAGLYSWGLLLPVALAGLLGSLAESVLGTVAEARGWLDNDLLNATNTAIGAGIVVILMRLLR
jgi:uncharacterized protein (TIGR00297 family)